MTARALPRPQLAASAAPHMKQSDPAAIVETLAEMIHATASVVHEAAAVRRVDVTDEKWAAHTAPNRYIATELREQIAAVCGPRRQWERATAFHVKDDAHVTLAMVWNTRRKYEEAGYEVSLKTDDNDRDLLNVWVRARLPIPAPTWTPEVVEAYREALGITDDDSDRIDAEVAHLTAEQKGAA